MIIFQRCVELLQISTEHVPASQRRPEHLSAQFVPPFVGFITAFPCRLVACYSIIYSHQNARLTGCVSSKSFYTPKQGSMGLLDARCSIGFQNHGDQQLSSTQMRHRIYGIHLLLLSTHLCAASLFVVEGSPSKWPLSLGLLSMVLLPFHSLVPLCAPSTAPAMMLLRTLYRTRILSNSPTPPLQTTLEYAPQYMELASSSVRTQNS